MGSWGAEIFDNDIALDIEGEYQALLALDVPEDEAYELVKKEFLDCGDDVAEDSVFWFAMAAIQQKYGILMPEVKEHALHIINNNSDWMYKDYPQAPKGLKKREKVMRDLKEKLLAPPLPKRKVPKPRTSKPRWKIGDVVASKIVYPEYEYRWFFNKYVLYRVVRLNTSDVSFLKPGLAYNEWVFGALYDWIGDEIPDVSIIKDLDYYKIFNPQEECHKIRSLSMYWSPRIEKYTILQRDCECPMPSKHEMFADGPTSPNG